MEPQKVETPEELVQELRAEFGRIYTEDDFINDEELIQVEQS